MRLRDRIGWLHRRWFGRYVIEDPRPIAERAPYTYFVPSENELSALAPGDQAKINFVSIPLSPEWGAERMWLTITSADGETLVGELDNEPLDMPQLRYGDIVTFRRSDVIDLIWSETRGTTPPPAPARREYWERCLVDDQVLCGEELVGYLYREEPNMGKEDDKYPDSGWRLRGDLRGLSDEEMDGRDAHYVALGAVLNQDDSWLHLIDQPNGKTFWRNWETGKFEAEAD